MIFGLGRLLVNQNMSQLLVIKFTRKLCTCRKMSVYSKFLLGIFRLIHGFNKGTIKQPHSVTFLQGLTVMRIGIVRAARLPGTD